MSELQGLLREKIVFRSERCLLKRNAQTSCRSCEQVCPAGAIESRERSICFDSLKCENCGACRAACPTEAFTFESFGFLREICSLDQEEVAFGCTLNKANRRDFNLCCYAQLTEGELIYLLSQKKSLVFFTQQCVTCAYKLGFQHFLNHVDLGRDLFKANARIQLCQEPAQSAGVSRRLFFQWIREKAVTALGAALPGEPGETVNRIPGRRYNLLRGLNCLPQVPGEVLFVREIKASSACTGCGGCVSICPDKAFKLTDNQLTWQAKRCLNCGLCLETCPEKALNYAGQVLTTEFFEVKVLREFQGRQCTGCGSYFGGEGNTCRHCLSKGEFLVEDFHSNLRGMLEITHF
jgi:ferredoxin